MELPTQPIVSSKSLSQLLLPNPSHQKITHNIASHPRMLNRKEAVSFVENVQTEFEDDPGKYEKFLDIMWDLKGDVIGPSEVLVRIAALFNGYPDLAREFNAFLPPGYLLHPKGEGKSSHILLTTPEGTTVWPRDHVGVRQRR